MSEDDNVRKIRDFFKSNVIINELDEVLSFKAENLIGIDRIMQAPSPYQWLVHLFKQIRMIG